MDKKGDAANAVTRNLHAAIERVREDVAKVEFWADAVTGFTQPVPGYDHTRADVWLPNEQAQKLEGKSADKGQPACKDHQADTLHDKKSNGGTNNS